MAKNQVSKKMLAEIEEKLARLASLEESCKRHESNITRIKEEMSGIRKRTHMLRICYQKDRDQAAERKEEWITKNIPLPTVPYQRYILAGSAYLLYRPNSAFSHYETYVKALAENGFEKHSEVTWGNGTFACYHNDEAAVFVSYVEAEKTLRVSVDHLCDTNLVPDEEMVDGTPNVTTPELLLFDDFMYDMVDCGMCYVFRLHDGSFVIIDSGYHRPESIVDALYTRLRQLSEGRPIVVSAWIFTHTHGDHIFAFNELGKKYGKEIEIKRVIHNFPDENMLYRTLYYDAVCGERGDLTGFNHCLQFYAGEHEFYRARTGQVFRFAGMQIDILFSQEDYTMPAVLSEAPYDYNASSLAFRITIEGQSYMFLGDLSTINNDAMVKRYGELMKSDVVQVAHHGFPGGTKLVYDAIQAPVVLWPCPWYDVRPGIVRRDRYNNPNWSPITRQMVKDHAKVVYVQCLGTYILPLPLSTEHLPEVVPALREEDLYHGTEENAD